MSETALVQVGSARESHSVPFGPEVISSRGYAERFYNSPFQHLEADLYPGLLEQYDFLYRSHSKAFDALSDSISRDLPYDVIKQLQIELLDKVFPNWRNSGCSIPGLSRLIKAHPGMSLYGSQFYDLFSGSRFEKINDLENGRVVCERASYGNTEIIDREIYYYYDKSGNVLLHCDITKTPQGERVVWRHYTSEQEQPQFWQKEVGQIYDGIGDSRPHRDHEEIEVYNGKQVSFTKYNYNDTYDARGVRVKSIVQTEKFMFSEPVRTRVVIDKVEKQGRTIFVCYEYPGIGKMHMETYDERGRPIQVVKTSSAQKWKADIKYDGKSQTRVVTVNGVQSFKMICEELEGSYPNVTVFFSNGVRGVLSMVYSPQTNGYSYFWSNAPGDIQELYPCIVAGSKFGHILRLAALDVPYPEIEIASSRHSDRDVFMLPTDISFLVLPLMFLAARQREIA